MKVFVLDGGENQAVACVRSLARQGHQVLVGATTRWSKAGSSRYCYRTFTYLDPVHDCGAFVQALAKEIEMCGGGLVLPMTERTTLPISARRELFLERGGSLVLPPHSSVLQALDKSRMIALAESLGIQIPRSHVVHSREQATEIATAIPYPAVLKPSASYEPRDGRLLVTGAPTYARGPAEFLDAVDELMRRCSVILVQEFVPGRGTGYFALMREGELRAEFAHLRIRDVRPTGSGSSLRVSVECEPSQREAALKILHALRWNGVAMVEFRIRPDGRSVFLELNGRFWNSLALAVFAGVDFPSLLAHMAEHGDVERRGPYRTGIRCRWILGDFRHLIEVWRGKPPGYPGRFPGRLRTLMDVLLPVPGTYHDNFSFEDPLPEIMDWLDLMFWRLPARLRQRQYLPNEKTP